MKHQVYKLESKNGSSALSLIKFMQDNYNWRRNETVDKMQATWKHLPTSVCHALMHGTIHSQECGDSLIVVDYEHKYRVSWLNKFNDLTAGSTVQGSDNLEAAFSLARDMAKHFGHADVQQSEPTSRDWSFDLQDDGTVTKLEM